MGGITLENAGFVYQAGANGVAVISSISKQGHLGKQQQSFVKCNHNNFLRKTYVT
ncbi:hypothetical protein [Metabacillus sediminilitoris]|uniref:hypothetical protein n=1 Tax=Metabacillus sediminilitoris TaxID=2567941 RepID=UPI001F3D2916|nr:hypothetical protein [Metabacillus sediminilitoris]